MAKRKTSARKKKKTTTNAKLFNIDSKYQNHIIGFIMILVSAFSLFKLGFLGITFDNIVRFFIGDSSPFGLLIALVVGFIYLIKGPKLQYNKRWIIGGTIFYLGLTLFLSALLFSNSSDNAFISKTLSLISQDFIHLTDASSIGGGMIGACLLVVFDFLVSILGSEILSIIMMIVGLIVFFNVPMNKVMDNVRKYSEESSQKIGSAIEERKQRHLEERQDNQDDEEQVEDVNPMSRVQRRKNPASVEEKPKIKLSGWMDNEPEKPEVKSKPEANLDRSDFKSADDYNQDTRNKPKLSEIINGHTENDSKGIDIKDIDDSNYQLPPIGLLSDVARSDQKDEFKNIDHNTTVLKKTLNSFGVDAEIKNVNLGPSVTEYELHPAIGVKVSKIVNLADDLALALAAKDIRIEAPIPGKSLIGIEVPNKKVAMVSFKDVVKTSQQSKHGLLTVPLGRNVSGDVITTDLTKLPHLLIAGSTGSGKSVAINGIITSILMNAKPSEVKMMLIDPKKVELGIYNGIPHLLSPVVSEPKKAARALNKVVAEMEHRYDLFAKHNQRKISTFNEYLKGMTEEERGDLKPLPYIVVVVDELADLMMTVSNDVEGAIIRLAQMGRAAGIHMILATQRPSVDVITGLIKSNVPSRIAFAVSSGIDSRTILDTNGAEKLLGRGDMLYLPIDKNKPSRVQGAFISDQDVENVVDYIKEQQPAEYDDDMIVTDEEIKVDEENEDQDDLFDDALAFVVKEQKASTSLLQRNFRIGYNRAARIIDDLEQRGYIGPQEGSKPREVYKQPDND
ncbi:DNA segregation ATPase FtsK SpoIIIE related protein [Apilactobacillus kunkeei DSM 12361 = ATCC 700308]|uniref:DNA segregation ATPase FtsK SpoIIIE related protein n=1 Tax=Apilactobacillus kunkeei DSM 12361 = ATCC 700308 TaxID=1423768 RepID=A0A0R1FRI0_9LACO|nr:DNA translocase FtsK [Apilactobacillus kunkeei]KOY73195.1 DNA segregation ATPase FtsK/SpoIIIE related protein [Apilactobacillus kunkeei DSM 12361 = ATCC 700308]KRK24550.1 DNA segregation ATPase FtsK SpoIIIE related protein [Apilactobacillus kunkeei DSM 12361 = ATCC 700308]QYU52640.1 DNA translocase FtsK [Apilactobacillus kunkeei]